MEDRPQRHGEGRNETQRQASERRAIDSIRQHPDGVIARQHSRAEKPLRNPAAFDDGDMDIRMDLSDQPRQAFHEDIPASAGPAG